MTKCTRYRTYIQTCMCFTAAVLLNVVVLACGRVDEPGHLVDECSSRLGSPSKAHHKIIIISLFYDYNNSSSK